MTIDRAEMKRLARQRMRETRPSVYFVTLLLLALLLVLDFFSLRLMYSNDVLEVMQDYIANAETQSMTEYMDAIALGQSLAETNGIGRLIDIAISIVTLMLNTGFAFFCLNVSRGAPAAVGNLLDAFGIFFKVLGLSIVGGIFVFLWSLLLFIPGIIASYRYSFAIYILLDDPGKGVMQCIAESKEMTNGWKWELFILDLSFLGWALLCMIPFVGVFVNPYMQITQANYYCHISGTTAPLDYTFADAPGDDSGYGE